MRIVRTNFVAEARLLLHLRIWTFLMAFPLLAMAESKSASPWLTRVWQTGEGTPDNNVLGMVQDAEGFVWIVTENDLARFDGLRFRRTPVPLISPEQSSNPDMLSLAFVGTNEFWLGFDGGTVMQLSPNVTNIFTSTNGMPPSRPFRIVEDRGGSMLVSYLNGDVCRIANGKVTAYTEGNGLQGAELCWLERDGRGQVWFGQADRVGVVHDDRFIQLTNVPGTVRICPARTGGIWIFDGTDFFKYDAGGELVKLPAVKDPPSSAGVMLDDGTGGLWVGTGGNGLFHYNGAVLTKVDVSHNDVKCLLADLEGNVWAGTGGGGLNRLRPRVIELQNVDAGLPLTTINSIAEDAAGNLWAAIQDGLYREENGIWKKLSQADGWTGSTPRCVLSDSNGTVWISAARNRLYEWRKNRFMPPAVLGKSEDRARSLLQDSAENLWIGFEKGGILLRPPAGRTKTILPSTPTGGQMRAIAEDPAHTIWLATREGSLFRVKEDQLTDETWRLVPRAESIRCLLATPDGSLWIGFGGEGVGRLRGGKFFRIGPEQGLHDGRVCAIVADERGSLWFGTEGGIFCVRQRELDDVAEGKATHVTSMVYGKDEGWPSLQSSFAYAPRVVRRRDGRICFAMQTGLAVVHADRVWANLPPPRVFLDRVAVDGRTVDMRETRTGLKFAANHRRLDVEFTTPSFVAPENVRFRHRLDGYDEAWSDPETVRSVNYLRLPAGHYRLRVTACNNAGVWSETDASFSFEVTPFFWQTWWFRLAVLGIFTGSVIGIVRYASFRRLRRRLELLEKETALQNERARIARDIHDELGANLTQIALLSELAQSDFEKPATAKTHINRIFGTARSLTRSLDEIVWAVNPDNDTLDRFVAHLCTFGPEFVKAAGARCRLDIPEDIPARSLSSHVRHHLHLSIKEALHNVVKHASATEVWLRMKWSPEEVTLIVEDNGSGFRPNSLPGQDGLSNLQQRMVAIGGRFEHRSQPGRGTVIVFVVPLETEAGLG